MKILIVGANGQLGKCLEPVVSETEGYEAVALSRVELDITSVESVFVQTNSIQPDLIVNAAAYTAVDRAENEIEAAYAVNSTGVKNLAEACAQMAIPLIHVSTDYVFDGNAKTPYLPEGSTSPIGVYGKSKLEGERTAAAALDELIIVRTAWVYSEYGNNFVKTMLRLAEERNELSVVNDQIGCPTYAGNIALAILKICKAIREGKQSWGIYHYVDQPAMSWHEFAESVFGMALAKGLIEKSPSVAAISSSEYPTKAKRPAYSVLNTQRIQQEFGIDPAPVNASLANVLTRISETSGTTCQ